MADKIIQVPGVGNVAFPDTMSDDDISSAIRGQMSNTPNTIKQIMAASQARNSQPTQFERDRMSDVGLAPVQRAVAKAAGQPAPNLSNLEPTVEGKFVPKGTTASALPAAAANNLVYPGVGTAAQGVKDIAQGNVARGAHGILSGGFDALSTATPMALESAPAAVAKALAAGYAGNKAGSGVASILGATPDQQALAGDVTGAVAGGLAAKTEFKSPIPKEVTVRRLTEAFNPDPVDAPKFKQDLATHLDDVVQHAQQNGLPLASASDFAQATKSTGQVAHDFYYNNMLKPIENVSVQIPRNSQAGRISGEYNREASLGEINNRLTEINSTLYPKYAKGGVAGSAAVGSEQAAALRVEGAQLRDILNNEMAKRLDLRPSQIAAVRSKMGTLRQMGEDLQFYSDSSSNRVNKVANEPIQGDTKIPAYVAQRMQIKYRRAFGNPVDKGVANTMSRYKAGNTSQPEPTVLTPTSTPARGPIDPLNVGRDFY